MKGINEDILKTGFVSEMVVTAMLRNSGWVTFDHSYYVDKDENKGREIDAIAIKFAEAQGAKRKAGVRLVLSVEIKKSFHKPLVIFTAPRAQTEHLDGFFDTNLIHMSNQEIWFNHYIQTIQSHKWIASDG